MAPICAKVARGISQNDVCNSLESCVNNSAVVTVTLAGRKSVALGEVEGPLNVDEMHRQVCCEHTYVYRITYLD